MSSVAACDFPKREVWLVKRVAGGNEQRVRNRESGTLQAETTPMLLMKRPQAETARFTSICLPYQCLEKLWFHL